MPDLNSVPASPRGLAASRRHSGQQLPLTPPAAQSGIATDSSSSLNILPSNQSAVNQSSSSSLPSPQLTTSQPVQQQQQPSSTGATAGTSVASEAGVGFGPGPLRHPRPLTATELHMQLEKEQEAVVNRLTRELTLLRAAQNASVASNTSSTSAGTSAYDTVGDNSLLSSSGFTIPTTRRHHRASSSTSQNIIHSQSSTAHDPRSLHARPPQAIPLARQDSAASGSRNSQGNSPAPAQSLDPSGYFLQQRMPTGTASIPSSSVNATPGSSSLAEQQLSPGLLPATTRYEETAFHRGELESAKRENEALKKRIRDLEKLVRERRSSDAGRSTRSESVSTTASVSITPAGGSNIAPPRDAPVPARQVRERGMTAQSTASFSGSVGVGVPDEEVQVGESASSLIDNSGTTTQ